MDHQIARQTYSTRIFIVNRGISSIILQNMPVTHVPCFADNDLKLFYGFSVIVIDVNYDKLK